VLKGVPPRGAGVSMAIERSVKATPEAAFDAFTDPAHLSRWYTSSAEADLRPGGRYANADGDQGTFLIFSRPREFRLSWENPDHAPGSVVTVVFHPDPAEGRVRVRMEHAQLADSEEVIDVRDRWMWAMDCYQAYVDTGRPISRAAWEAKQRQAGR
jgi:uncharacterized protein YndB with AHSA1/START domain